MKNCCRFFGVLLAGKRQSSCCSLVLQSLHLVLQFSRHLTWWYIVLKSPHLMLYSPSSPSVIPPGATVLSCDLVFQLPHLVLARTSIISLRSAWHFSHLTWCQSLVFQSPLQATKSGPLVASPSASWSSSVISPGATWYFIRLTWCHNAVFQSAYLVYTVWFFGHLTWCKLVLESSHPVLKSGPTVTIPENKGLLRRHLTWCQSPVLSHSHHTCKYRPALQSPHLPPKSGSCPPDRRQLRSRRAARTGCQATGCSALRREVAGRARQVTRPQPRDPQQWWTDGRCSHLPATTWLGTGPLRGPRLHPRTG